MLRFSAASLLTLALVAGSCTIHSTGECATDADCLDGALCVDNVCQGADAPTASFTAPQKVKLGAPIQLDASASTRAGNGSGALVYRWTVVAPEGVTLEGASGPTPVLRADVPKATYLVRLVVIDQGTSSAAVEKSIEVENSLPTARIAEPTEAIGKNASVVLDATSSMDPDADALAFRWTLVQEPASAGGTLTPGPAGKATLVTGAVAGRYTVRVTVSDGAAETTAELVRTVDNAPPVVTPGESLLVAHACSGDGAARTCVASGRLNGTATDPDGTIDTTSIRWALVSSPTESELVDTNISAVSGAGLVSAFRLTSTVDAPIAGNYEFELSATDNEGARTTRRVTVKVTNEPPVVTFVGTTPREVPHTNDEETNEWVAEVPVEIVITDPEGDKLGTSFEELDLSLMGESVRASVAVADALHGTYTLRVSRLVPSLLIDAEGAPIYELLATVTDINRGTGEARLPLLVTNRAPTLVGLVDQRRGRHAYGLPESVAALGRTVSGYHETFPLTAVFEDPDGDPITTAWSVESDSTEVSDEMFIVSGPATAPTDLLVFSEKSALVNSQVSVKARGNDAWGVVENTAAFVLGNRVPVIDGFAGATSEGHTFGTLPTTGEAPGYHHTFPLVAKASDPDGDPVTITWTVDSALVEDERVAINGNQFAPASAMVFSTGRDIVLNPFTIAGRVRDPFTETEERRTFTIGNRIPIVLGFNDLQSEGHTYGPLVEGASPLYHHTFELPELRIEDPDGDPDLVASWGMTNAAAGDEEFTFSGTALQPGQLRLQASTTALVTADNVVEVSFRDPFGGSREQRVLRVGNRAPTVDAPPTVAGGADVLGCPTMCNYDWWDRWYRCSAAYAPVGTNSDVLFQNTATPVDPDGDPVSIRWEVTAGTNKLQTSTGPTTFVAWTTEYACTSNEVCKVPSGVLLSIPIQGFGCGRFGRFDLTGSAKETTGLRVHVRDVFGATGQADTTRKFP